VVPKRSSEEVVTRTRIPSEEQGREAANEVQRVRDIAVIDRIRLAEMIGGQLTTGPRGSKGVIVEIEHGPDIE